jgi:hypothetical protein
MHIGMGVSLQVALLSGPENCTNSKAKSGRYFLPTHTLASEFAELAAINMHPGAAEVFPLGPGVAQAGTDTLGNQAALQFCNCTKHCEDHFARRRRGVHLFGQTDKLDAQGAEGVQGAEQVRDGASEAVKLPDHNGVKPASVRVGQ